ncbi:MAG: apolipoprotein N-acyltransferase [Pseudomonadota bacterium]|nr:apolipoprotein N-acyltransferase [Pseudomonadota bacterium]
MKFIVALLAGALSAFAFQPFGFIALMPIALALLAGMIANATRLRGAFALGWGFGVGQFCVGLNWIATSFTYQAAMPAWLGWVSVFLLSLYLAVYPMLAAGLAWRIGRRNGLALVLALAAGWIACEFLRAGIFTGFAWNPVGVVLVDTPLRRASGLIGTYGLSGLTVLIGGALWLALRRLREGGYAMIPVLLAGIGSFLLPHAATTSGPAVRVIQPNIGQAERWSPGLAQAQVARLLNLSGAPTAEPRLLLWPESAVTIPLEDDRTGARPQVDAVRQAVARGLGPRDLLVAGSEGLASTDGVRVTSARNSAFVLTPSGRLLGRYDKAHLVPYGEYLPMRPILSAIGLSRLAPGDVDFDPGPGPRTIDLPGFGRMGMQICYEIIFSGEVVDRAHRPDFIFNPSNDAWFGRWGPPQHLAQARLRAAEEGLAVIRSTPTGISAIVDANGRLLQSLPWREPGELDGRIPAPRAPTPFALLGNLLPLLFAFALMLVALWRGREPIAKR